MNPTAPQNFAPGRSLANQLRGLNAIAETARMGAIITGAGEAYSHNGPNQSIYVPAGDIRLEEFWGEITGITQYPAQYQIKPLHFISAGGSPVEDRLLAVPMADADIVRMFGTAPGAPYVYATNLAEQTAAGGTNLLTARSGQTPGTRVLVKAQPDAILDGGKTWYVFTVAPPGTAGVRFRVSSNRATAGEYNGRMFNYATGVFPSADDCVILNHFDQNGNNTWLMPATWVSVGHRTSTHVATALPLIECESVGRGTAKDQVLRMSAAAVATWSRPQYVS